MLHHNNGKLIRLINQADYFLLCRYILVVQWLGIDWPYRIGAIFTRNQRQDAGGGGRTVCQALVWHRAQNRLQCGKHSVRSYTWPEQGRPRVRDWFPGLSTIGRYLRRINQWGIKSDIFIDVIRRATCNRQLTIKENSKTALIVFCRLDGDRPSWDDVRYLGN